MLRFEVTRKVLFVVVCAISILAVSRSIAAPLYYTFAGTIQNRGHTSHDFNDAAGFISGAGFQYGDDVSFTFLIDFARPAYNIRLNGSVQTLGAPFFMDSYFSGSAIYSTDTGFYTAANGFGSSEFAEKHVGFLDANNGQSWLTGGSSNDGISIEAISSWTIGADAMAYSYAFSASGLSSQYTAQVALIAISNTPFEVPEGTTFPLALLGLICLGWVRVRCISFARPMTL